MNTETDNEIDLNADIPWEAIETEHGPIESWRHVWRVGLAPLFTREELEALRVGLLEDDPRLLQGVTVSPPPLATLEDWDADAACLIGFCAYAGDWTPTVGQITRYFGEKCHACDMTLGEECGVKPFLDFWDYTPREEAIREMLVEVVLSLCLKS